MPTVEYSCPICKDTEWIVVRKEVFKQKDKDGNDVFDNVDCAEPCECRAKKHYQNILERSGISEAFKRKTFDNFETRGKPKEIVTAKKECIEYSKSFIRIRKERENSISLLGQPGSGKTHLSIAIVNELMKMCVGVLYMQYVEALVRLKQFINDEEVYPQEIYRYKNAPVLLIDDLFKTKTEPTPSDLRIMFEIINFRYLNNKPIIVSSEKSPEQLLEYDEAVGSRVIEMCKGRIIEFYGPELNHRLGA